MTPIVMVWVVLGIATIGLALYRKLISASEEDVVHLAASEQRQIPAQVALAQKLEVIDRWGKTLTIVTVAFGLVIAAAYMYQAWVDPSTVPNNFFRRN